MAKANKDQMASINAMAVDHHTRPFSVNGVTLSLEQYDSLGEDKIDWLCKRFDLQVEETSTAVHFVSIPAA